MTIRTGIRTSLAAALLAVLAATSAGADEAWVRIDAPDPVLREQLPAEAIDYGRFVWMPERVLPAAARAEARVHRMERPIDLPIDPPGVERITDPSEPGFHLVQFRGPVQNAWLARLGARGLEPVQFIAPNAYLVWGREDQLPPVSGRPADPVRLAVRLPDRARLNPLRRAPDPHEHARAMIHAPTATQTLNALRAAGATVRNWRAVGGELLVVDLQIAPERHSKLLGINGVLTLQQVSQDTGPRGELANQSVVALDAPDQTLIPGYREWLKASGLDGTGVAVAVVDAGIRQTHQDLAGQFVDCTPGPNLPSSCSQDDDNHGTHVAAAIAGTGASNVVDSNGFLRGLGMAPGVRLVQQRYPELLGAGPGGMLPGSMLTIFAESALSGAVLANNSWGPSVTPQGYDIPTREVDLITRNALPDGSDPFPILPVWAIMNGSGDNPDSVCAPSSLGAPDEAKNLLAVGSSKLQLGDGSQRGDLFDISFNSAHGPACDGRRVPQLIAPGCATDNPVASSDSAYSSNFCGTSMAAPMVTGAAALFVEQYRNTHNGRTPSPALIKARITASARNLQGFRDADGATLGHRPDRKQGWGRLDADALINPNAVVVLLDQTRILTETGQAWTGRFAPADPEAPMQIMLAWTDAPGHGLGGDLPAWVNDLDLIVHQDNDAFYGNDFGGDGFSRANGTPDVRNNLEGVVIGWHQHAGEPVRIEVLAANLAADALDPWNPADPAQDFALVCSNCERAPDFTLDLSPQVIRACLDESPLTAEATVRPVLGFDEEVTLVGSASGGFGGTLALETSGAVPAYSRALSIDTVDAQAGDYRIQVQGTAAEAGTITSTLSLGLDAPLTSGPEAVSPPPGETASIASGFAWTALDGAEQYRFVLARDAQFSQIVDDRLLDEASWQPPNWLAGETTYYWRVSGRNACGEGAVSDTFALQTGPGPAAALAFLTPPDPDREGGFSGPVEVEILDTAGQRTSGDNHSQVELILEDAADGAELTGTLSRQVSAGVATFDDLGIRAETDGTFGLRAVLRADEPLDIEPFSLGTLQTKTRQAAAGLASSSPVTGLAFAGSVSGISESPSFASDLRLAVTAPDGARVSLGGFQTESDQAWAFDGEDSGSDGRYESEHPTLFSDLGASPDDEGFWQFEFRNDFGGGELMSWDDVQITLIKQAIETSTESIPIRGNRIFTDRFESN